MSDTLANLMFDNEYLLVDDDEPLTFLYEDEEETVKDGDIDSWNVMIVDDDAEP